MTVAIQSQKEPMLYWFLGASISIHMLAAIGSQTLSRPSYTPPRTIEIELAPVGRPAAPEKKTAPPVSPVKKKTPPPVKKASQKINIPAQKYKPVAKPTPKTVPTPTPTAEPVARPQAESARPESVTPRKTLSDVRNLLKAKTGAGVPGDNTYQLPTNARGRIYYNQINAAVRSVWSAPPGTRNAFADIDITIGSSGKLLQKKLIKSSGDSLYNRSILSALDIADFPAPPADFRTPFRIILHIIPPED